MRATPEAVSEVAAALTGRHLKADGFCNETHYPEAIEMVKFMEQRGYEVKVWDTPEPLATKAGRQLRLNLLYHNSECDRFDDFVAVSEAIKEIESEMLDILRDRGVV